MAQMVYCVENWPVSGLDNRGIESHVSKIFIQTITILEQKIQRAFQTTALTILGSIKHKFRVCQVYRFSGFVPVIHT